MGKHRSVKGKTGRHVEARDRQRVVRSLRRVPWEGAEAG